LISVVITTYGNSEWQELAWGRAYPSALEQGADNIVVHHEETLAIGPARNAAASKVPSDDWLIFLDADDELESNYVTAMRQETDGMWRTDHLRLLQPSVRYVRKGRVPAPVLAPANDLRVDNYLVIGTCIHKSVFDRVGGFNDYPHGFEDWSLWAKAWRAGARVVPVPDAVYRAHVNPMSAHRRAWRDRKWQVAEHLRVQAELFPEGV
jgi:glycosyltransferase involved in cell wall biosynthesis